MNKTVLFQLMLLFICLPFISIAQTTVNPLPECPDSPNCFRSSSMAKKAIKQPISIEGSAKAAEQQLIKVLESFQGARREKDSQLFLHYTFKTKLGKFIDDVLFYFDEENGLIHFRSASRVGWSDMGANRRRIKKIKMAWNLMTQK